MPITKLYEHPDKEAVPYTRVIAVDVERPEEVVCFRRSSPKTLIEHGYLIGSEIEQWFSEGIDEVSPLSKA